MVIRAVVVGGTSGIGYAMACRVAATLPATSTVLISGRTKPANLPHANMEFRALDATSMRQIQSYTSTLKSSGSLQARLDYLIMTQGIMSTAPRTETPGEGIDRKMALHYYGKQLLIRELLPILSPSAKIIIVYDGWLGSPDKLLWEDLDLKHNYGLKKAADHCTTMNDAMVQYWAKTAQVQAQAELDTSSTPTPVVAEKRHFIHAYPGGVNTNILRDVVPSYLQGVVKALGNVLITSPEKCAERLLTGAEQRAKEGREEGRFWSNIGNKGELLKGKAVWTEEQLARVVEHTWALVDGALAAKG